MARLVALPVPRGDSFYLERDGRSVLVDGGDSREAFPHQFREHVNRFGADIVACTHNDADHAKGVISFLNTGMRCREVWLPGRWLATVPDLMRPWDVVAEDVLAGAAECWTELAFQDGEKPTSIEQAGTMVDGPALEAEEARDESADEWPDEVATADDEHETASPNSWDPWWARRIPLPTGPAEDPNFWKVVNEALEAGKNIKEIARLAYGNGVPVRWFEHAPGSHSGLDGFLHVVNARRIARVFPHRTLFERLALTTVNKESLVLYSPQDSSAPGVLFCGDSDLHGTSLSLGVGDLVTAPHHGSADNAAAYRLVVGSSPAPGSITWVRSDRRSRTRPCQEYLSAPGRRFCTVCRSGVARQAVALFGRRGGWARYKDVKACCC